MPWRDILASWQEGVDFFLDKHSCYQKINKDVVKQQIIKNVTGP